MLGVKNEAGESSANATSYENGVMEKVRALRKHDPIKARKLQKRLKNKLKRNAKQTDNNNIDKDSELKQSERVLQTDDSTHEGSETGDESVQFRTVSVEEEMANLPAALEGLHHLKEVFERFQIYEETRGSGRGGSGDEEYEYDERDDPMMERLRGNGIGIDKEDAFADDEEEDFSEKKKEGMSKKKIKKMMRPSVSHLKTICSRPEVVESWDTTAPDPATLVFLKSTRNSVTVPAHWSHKRKYLQGKRGLDKTLFRLPHYIEATRIAEIRSAIEQKDAQKTLKQKMRERVRPRHRKMNIDYQVLHDAFFKYATKPPYTKFGDIYFEGKEAEILMRKYTPGKLSERAREALGMATTVDPPPWLLNMQRYGPPPSYPNMIVPGVNAHIPDGAALGFQSGGWGRPPTLEQLLEWGVTPRFDEVIPADGVMLDEASQTLWGQLQTLESSEEESGDEKMDDLDMRGIETPMTGISTPVAIDPSGLSSVVSTSMLLGVTSVGTTGLETPGSVDLARGGFLTDNSLRPYTILEQSQAPLQPGALFASNTIYQIPSDQSGTARSTAMLGGTATPFGHS